MQKGFLWVEYPGVYRVGHRARSLESDFLAAVYAGGDGALLSGLAAAFLWRLINGSQPLPEIITPTERRIKGVRTRRSRSMDRRDATVFRGVPVTTVARTLVDLAAVLSVDDLARACHEARVRYGTTPARVEWVLARRPNSPGAANLRLVLRGDAHLTLSRLEHRFLELLAEHKLLQPETNRSAGGRYVDCRWPDLRLTVELDSYRYHESRHAWELDRRREREAYARGDDFRRYTWGDVFDGPRQMIRELRSLLPAVLE